MTKLKLYLKKFLAWLKRHWKLVSFLFIIGILVILYFAQKKSAQPELTFQHPQVEDLSKTLDVSGIIDAKEKANMRFLLGGKVVYLGAKEGDWVKKWQTIATIDKAALEKQMQQDLNNYMKERWDWEQTLDDTKDRALPKEEERQVDKNQWDLNNQVLTVEIKDIAIRDSALYAPFAGILIKSPTNVTGVQLVASDTFDIVNPTTLVFKAAIDEADISQVKLDQAAEIELDAYPDEIIHTKVNYISFSSSQSSTGTVFVVEFPIDSQDLTKYKLGMNGDISLFIETKPQVLTIPLDATRDRDDKTYVDVKTGDSTYEEREITTGLETDDTVEVTSGLTINDEVLIPE